MKVTILSKLFSNLRKQGHKIEKGLFDKKRYFLDMVWYIIKCCVKNIDTLWINISEKKIKNNIKSNTFSKLLKLALSLLSKYAMTLLFDGY